MRVCRGLFLGVAVLHFRPYLSDWQRCWRNKYMRLLAIGGVLQGALATCPAAITDHLPTWFLNGASLFSFMCLVLAGLGIGKESRKDGPDVQTP